MPYKSKAQAAFMHIHHPDIAKRWDRKYYHKALEKHKRRNRARRKSPGLHATRNA